MTDNHESIAWEWFPLIADRLKHPLDAKTVAAYVRAFERANITPRGLMSACEIVFDSAKWWPAPEDFIQRARAAEARLRQSERPTESTPTIGAHDFTPEQRLAEAREFAKSWVDLHRDEYGALVASINAECCHRFKLVDVRHMSPIQKEFRDASVITACVKKAYDAAMVAAPAVGGRMADQPSWDQKIAKARAKLRELFGKDTPAPPAIPSVSGGSQSQPDPV